MSAETGDNATSPTDLETQIADLILEWDSDWPVNRAAAVVALSEAYWRRVIADEIQQQGFMSSAIARGEGT